MKPDLDTSGRSGINRQFILWFMLLFMLFVEYLLYLICMLYCIVDIYYHYQNIVACVVLVAR